MASMHCKKCGYIGEGLSVTSSRYRKDGTRYVQYICRPCNALKKRREIIRNNSAERRANTKWKKENPEKVKAHRLARRFIKLKPCEVCTNPRAVRHHDDYSKPLDVRFLCPLHHKQLHMGVLV